MLRPVSVAGPDLVSREKIKAFAHDHHILKFPSFLDENLSLRFGSEVVCMLLRLLL